MKRAVITSAGARSALGANLEQTFFGLRAQKLTIRRTELRDKDGEFVGAFLDRTTPADLFGLPRWLELSIPAFRDALATPSGRTRDPMPIIIALSSDDERLGRTMIDELADEAGVTPDRKHSSWVAAGAPGFAVAVARALDLVRDGAPRVAVGAVDSFHDPKLYAALDDDRRILSARSRDGFIPGEGAAFAIIEPSGTKSAQPIATIAACEIEEEREDPDIASAWTRVVESAAAKVQAPIPWVITNTNGEHDRELVWSFVAHRLRREIDPDRSRVSAMGREMGDAGSAAGALGCAIACQAFLAGAAEGSSVLVALAGEGPLRAALVRSPAGRRSEDRHEEPDQP